VVPSVGVTCPRKEMNKMKTTMTVTEAMDLHVALGKLVDALQVVVTGDTLKLRESIKIVQDRIKTAYLKTHKETNRQFITIDVEVEAGIIEMILMLLTSSVKELAPIVGMFLDVLASSKEDDD
jgi:hypothetical protein